MKDLDILEIAGSISYGKHPVGKEIEIYGTKYVVADIHDNTNGNGLQAMTLQNTETGEYVIAYQGTTDIIDLLTDVSIVSGVTPPQFDDAKKYYEEMQKKFNGKINYVCGNSLGGGLANYVAIHHKEVKSVTYNPAILPTNTTIDSEYKNIKNYISPYDPLTLVELAAGFKRGIPGEIVQTRNNIPSLMFLLTNHVGYVGYSEEMEKQGKIKLNETTGEYEIKLKTGKVPIRMNLINRLPFSVFSKDFLDYSYQGKGTKITLDVTSLEMLKNGVTRIVENIAYAEKYLNESNEIVHNEGDKFDSRMEELTEISDDIFKSFGIDIPKIINEAEEAYNDMNPALKSIYNVAEKINSVPVISNVFNFTISLNPVTDLLLIIPRFIGSLGDLLDSYSYLKRSGIAVLFKDCDKLFDDGLPKELGNHLNLIAGNQDIVLERLNTYSMQTSEVWNMMSSADNAKFHINDIPVSIIPTMNVKELEENKKFENIIKQKNKQLENNYSEFSKAVHREFDETLKALYQTSCKALQGIYDLRSMVKGIESVSNWADIPVVSWDDDFFDDIYRKSRKVREDLDKAVMTFNGIRELLRVASNRLDEILTAIKPYAKNAIFNNVSYNDIMVYNLAAYNIYESSSISFKEIEYQLSENESEAISVLATNSEILKNDMVFLMNQIKKGTIC